MCKWPLTTLLLFVNVTGISAAISTRDNAMNIRGKEIQNFTFHSRNNFEERNHQGRSDKLSSLVTMVWKFLGHLEKGCNIVLISEDMQKSFMADFASKDVGGLQSLIIMNIKMMGGSIDLPNLLKATHGEQTTICRAFIVDFTINHDMNRFMRILYDSNVWLFPDAFVVLVGSAKRVKDVLQHKVFRNTINLTFLKLEEDLLKDTSSAIHTDVYLKSKVPMLQDVKKSYNLMVYNRCLFCDEGQPKLRFLFRWSTGNPPPDKLIPSFHHLDNFEGHLLRGVSMPVFPYIDSYLDSDEPATTVTLRDCVDKRLLDAFSTLLNFTYEVRAPWDMQWGIPTSTGNWTGMLGTIQQNKADFTTTIAPSPARLTMLNPARVYAAEELAIVSLKPQRLPQYLVITRPFTGDVWLYFVLIILIWGVSLWTLQKMRSRIEKQPSISLNSAIFYSWAVILEDPPPKTPAHITGQMLVGWWLLASLVIVTGYKSSLVAHLAVQSQMPPIDSFHDLVKREGWRWAGHEKTFTGAPLIYFQNSPDPVVKMIYKKVETTSIGNAFKSISQGRYSFIFWRNALTNIIASYHTDRFGNTPYYLSKGGHPILSDYGWGFRKGSPFHYRLSALMIHLIDGGLINYWIKDVMAQRVKEERRKIVLKVDPKTQTTSGKRLEDNQEINLGINHLIGVFLVLIAGYIISFMVLIAERIIR